MWSLGNELQPFNSHCCTLNEACNCKSGSCNGLYRKGKHNARNLAIIIATMAAIITMRNFFFDGIINHVNFKPCERDNTQQHCAFKKVTLRHLINKCI